MMSKSNAKTAPTNAQKNQSHLRADDRDMPRACRPDSRGQADQSGLHESAPISGCRHAPPAPRRPALLGFLGRGRQQARPTPRRSVCPERTAHGHRCRHGDGLPRTPDDPADAGQPDDLRGVVHQPWRLSRPDGPQRRRRPDLDAARRPTAYGLCDPPELPEHLPHRRSGRQSPSLGLLRCLGQTRWPGHAEHHERGRR